MSVSFSCRVSAYLFCLFIYFSNAFANQTSEYSIVATNTITSSKDSLSLCPVSASEETECQELNTILSDGRPISLHNPVALAANEKNFFIANYGMVGGLLGTSFILKCELPEMGSRSVTCSSILALFNAAHITGMNVIGQKLFFVRSFSYPSSSIETGEHHFLNSNFLNACNIPQDTDENNRIHECGSSADLSANGKIHSQNVFNTSMEITQKENFLYVADSASQVTYKCAIPGMDNNLATCEQVPFESPESALRIVIRPVLQNVK